MSNLDETPTTGPNARSFWKCDFCRTKRRKCAPEVRDWEGRRQRCRSCVAGGQECGPNTFHDGRLQQRPTSSSPSLPPNSMYQPYSSSSSSSGPYDSSNTFLLPSDISLQSSYDTWSSSPQTESSFGPGTTAVHAYARKDILKTKAITNAFRKPGPRLQDVVRTKLKKLCSICELFCAVKNRHRASLRSQPQPKTRFHLFDEIHNLLSHILHCTRIQFRCTCEDIRPDVEMLQDLRCKELFLVRLFHKIEHFLSIAADEVAPYGNDYARIEEQLRAVAQSIISLYEETGEESEADHYRVLLGVLRAKHNVSEHHSDLLEEQRTFIRMSARVSEAFRALDLDQRSERVLSIVPNAFPAAHLAVYHGRQNAARSLIERDSARALEVDLLSRGSAHLASETKDHALFRAASIQSKQTGRQRDVYGMEPSCIAAYIGDLDILLALKEAGHDLNVRDIAGRTLLCIASGAGHIEIVHYLLTHGVNPTEDYQLEQGRIASRHDVAHAYSALHAAAAGGHQEIAMLLLKHKASCLWQSYDRTPSQEAAAYGHHELAAMLFKAERAEAQCLDDIVPIPDIRVETADATSSPVASTAPSVASLSPLPLLDPSQPLRRSRSNSTRSASIALSACSDVGESSTLHTPQNPSQKRATRDSPNPTSRPPSRNVRTRLDPG